MVKTFLRARWHRTLALGKKPERNDDLILDALLTAYSEPHRHYHTCEHLMACFQVLDRVFPRRPVPPDPLTPLDPLHDARALVELALWFHDYTYDTKAEPGENERQSADEAEDIVVNGLGLPALAAAEVKNLILATRHTEAPTSREAKILVDVDLSILGESPEVFDAYEAQVRKEYAWVPDEAFKAGRKNVLKGFLDREWVYSTPEMRKTGYEGRAQTNLRRALARLEGT